MSLRVDYFFLQMENSGKKNDFNDSNHQLENKLTHEVFKHGFLMSQQVINNGLPSKKET